MHEANEDVINNMSGVFFRGILKALGKKLNYMAVVNLYGNAFAKDASKYVNDANPLSPEKTSGQAIAAMFKSKNYVQGSAMKDALDWAKG